MTGSEGRFIWREGSRRAALRLIDVASDKKLASQAQNELLASIIKEEGAGVVVSSFLALIVYSLGELNTLLGRDPGHIALELVTDEWPDDVPKAVTVLIDVCVAPTRTRVRFRAPLERVLSDSSGVDDVAEVALLLIRRMMISVASAQKVQLDIVVAEYRHVAGHMFIDKC